MPLFGNNTDELEAEVTTANQKRAAEKLAHAKTRKELAKIKGQLEVAEEELQAKSNVNELLEEYKDLHEDNLVKKIKLDEREKLLNAKAQAQESFKEEIAKLQQQIADAEDRGFKKGYSDGVSDGLRKGTDLTKDDRKMLAQIAALAVASHTPDATSMIAKEVAAGIAKDIQNELPATAESTNK